MMKRAIANKPSIISIDDAVSEIKNDIKNKWIPREDYIQKKQEQREIMKQSRKILQEKQIIKEIVSNIIENVVKTCEEEKRKKIRSTQYIRPRIRFLNGQRIKSSIKLIKE